MVILRKMRVAIVIYSTSIFVMFQTAFGISRKEEKLLGEEFHRGAEETRSSNIYDLPTASTFQQNTYQKDVDNNGYADGFPRSDYLVHERENIPEPAEPSAIANHDPTMLHSLYGYGGNAYGNNPELTQAYGYNINLPLGYGHGGDLSHQYGYGNSLAHYHDPELANCYGHGNHHDDYKQHYGGDGFGVTGIGNYIKKKLTLKKIFLPLAGIALLAAAGAWSSANPVLLQLGTIGAATGRSRVKRSNKPYVNSEISFIKQKLKDKIRN